MSQRIHGECTGNVACGQRLDPRTASLLASGTLVFWPAREGWRTDSHRRDCASARGRYAQPVEKVVDPFGRYAPDGPHCTNGEDWSGPAWTKEQHLRDCASARGRYAQPVEKVVDPFGRYAPDGPHCTNGEDWSGPAWTKEQHHTVARSGCGTSC